MQPGVRWFKGPSGETFKFRCVPRGIHVPSLAEKVQLKGRPLEINGVVEDFNTDGYIPLEEAAGIIGDLGQFEDNPIVLSGQPAGGTASNTSDVTPLRVAINHLAIEFEKAKATVEEAKATTDARIEDLKGVIDALGVKVEAALQRRRRGKGKRNDWVKAAGARLPPIRETMPLT